MLSIWLVSQILRHKNRSAQAIRNERMTFSQSLCSSHTHVQTLAVLPARQEPRGGKGEEILPVVPVRDTQETLVRIELGLSVALNECCHNPVWLMVAELAPAGVVQRELNCCSVHGSRFNNDPGASRSISNEVSDSPVVRLVSGEVEAAADPRGNHCLAHQAASNQPSSQPRRDNCHRRTCRCSWSLEYRDDQATLAQPSCLPPAV